MCPLKSYVKSNISKKGNICGKEVSQNGSYIFFFALFCFSENPGLCRGNLAAIGQAKVTKVKVCVADTFCGL